MSRIKQHLTRIDTVDMVRGLAILFMIIVHTNAYFLSTGLKIVYDVWDIGEFSVPAFIFCAAYIYFRKSYPMNSWKDLFVYLKKRVRRLLVPYYVFMIAFILLVFLKEPNKITAAYVFQSIFAVGGIDLNWLVLLFLFFSILMPFVQFSARKSKAILYGFMGLSLISAIAIMLFRFPVNYRYIMWLPWSMLIILSMDIVNNENKTYYLLKSGIFWLVIFVVSLLAQLHLNHSLTMFNNKYPPNIYHLSFGAFSIIVVYYMAKKGLFSFFPVKRSLSFLSRNSYTLFFIHWTVIYVLWNYTSIGFNWISFFICVLVVSAAVQIIINKANDFAFKKAD